jgi:ubiquilin
MSTSTAATTAPTISFTIKSAQGERIEISDEPIQTKIKSLKETISERLGGTKSEAELLRLIYKGHVLKDEKTIEESQIGDGHAVHLVKSAPKQMQSNDNTNSSTTMTTTSSDPVMNNNRSSPRTWMDDQNAQEQPQRQAPDFATLFNSNVLGGGGLGRANTNNTTTNNNAGLNAAMFGGGMQMPTQQEMQAIENDPFLRQFMEHAMQDPEMLRPVMSMMEQNPQIQQLMNANPELRQAFSDPDTIARALQSASNPSIMREQMAATDRAYANIESHPEGFNALRRMYENVEVPMREAMNNNAGANANAAASNNNSNPFASLFGEQRNNETTNNNNNSANNDAPLPNPWAVNANAGAGSASTSTPFGGSPFGGGGFGAGMGMGMPDQATIERQMEEISNNPALMQMFSQQMSQIANDPNGLESLRRMNPQFDQMISQNPEIATAMQNPEFLRALADPQTLQAMTHMQRVMGNRGGMMGGGAIGSQFGGGGGSPFGAMVPPPENPEIAYAPQISQLNDMGFFDPAENVRALVATNGNVSAAIERLLNGA